MLQRQAPTNPYSQYKRVPGLRFSQTESGRLQGAAQQQQASQPAQQPYFQPVSKQAPTGNSTSGAYQPPPGVQMYAMQSGGGVFAPGSSAGKYSTPQYSGVNVPNPREKATVNWSEKYYVPSSSGRPGGGTWRTRKRTKTIDNPYYAQEVRNAQGANLMNQYVDAMNSANNANNQRYEDILEGYRELAGRSGDMHSERTDYLTNAYNQMGNQINSGYQDRYDKGMELLDGLGQAERDRINRSYDNQVGSIGTNLSNRGLNNTTIAGSMQNAINRNRNESQAALSEQLRREQFGAHSQMSYDQLAALQNILQSGTTHIDSANAQRISEQTGIPLEMLAFMERRNDVGPSMEGLMNLYMQLGRGY